VACREKLRLVGIAGSRCLSTVVVTAVAVAWRRADSHIWRMDRRKNDRRRTAAPGRRPPHRPTHRQGHRRGFGGPHRQTSRTGQLREPVTISAQDEDSIKAGKGIGAAREWIKAEFERYSKSVAAAWR